MKLLVRIPNVKPRKRMIVRAIVCGVLLVLPACQIPALRPAGLGSVLPASFNGSPNGPNGATISGADGSENSARLRVDEFYNDPVLTQLVCQAVAGNRELKVLEEEIQVARSEILYRRGAFLPLASLRAGGGWDRHSAFTPEGAAERQLEYRPGRKFPATPGDSLFGINFLLPLDIWRELRNARDAAFQRYLAAVERRNAFVTRLVADVADNYYNLMALDKRIEILDRTITLQQQSLKTAQAFFDAGRVSELPVRRFEAEVRRNQSEKAIVRQEIVEAENRINFLLGRLPQPVDRDATKFLDLNINALRVGVPAQLLENRPDIRQAERELAAAGLDVKVARAHFFPRVDITGGIGTRAFNPKFLFNPESMVLNAVGEVTAPLINKAAIRSEYLAANAKQLEAVYNYQRVIIDAFTEVINRLAMYENYTKSIELKQRQLESLATAVSAATNLYQQARIEYIELLIAQRDLQDARTGLVNAKRQQLSAVVNAYQALGGGSSVLCPPPDQPVSAAELPRLPDALPLPAPRPEKGPPEPARMPDPLPVPPAKGMP